MRDKIHQYLLQRPSGAAPRELLDLVFTQPGADPEFGPRFLQVLLGNDSRFVWREAERTWNAHEHELLARPLSDVSFIVLDLETTGGPAAATNIIEIAAARVRDGRVIEEFAQLVNPGSRLPPFITHLTGIDDAMLADQPPLAAVWPRVLQFLGDGVIVAHNAAFDVGFLNAAACTLSGAPLPHLHLCTIKLARRLLPKLRRRSLDALGAHFGIPLVARHRALGDVRITVEIFFHLLERLAARGVSRLDQVLDLQQHARDGRPFICLLPRDTVERLPAEPGIYRLFDADGGLLYVGKAKNLRQRVGSYLSNAVGHTDKTLDLIRHSRDVRVEVAGSELEAALAEADAIRRDQPPYNRLGKHLPRIAFLKLTVDDDYPRLFVTNKLGTRRGRYIGPFRSREQAEQVLALLTRLFRLRTCPGRLQPDAAAAPCFQGQVGACTAPCAARVTADAYAEQVRDCGRLLNGDFASAQDALTERRDAHAAALRFEAAARVQRDLDTLQLLVRRQRTLGWVLAQHNLLVLQPAVKRRSVLAYVVLSGRLARRTQLCDAGHVSALAEEIERLFPLYQNTALRADEVDGTTILAAWLRDRGETDGYVFQIADAAAPATQLSEWRAACASLLASAALPPEAAQPEHEGHEAQHPGGSTVSATSD